MNRTQYLSYNLSSILVNGLLQIVLILGATEAGIIRHPAFLWTYFCLMATFMTLLFVMLKARYMDAGMNEDHSTILLVLASISLTLPFVILGALLLPTGCLLKHPGQRYARRVVVKK